MIKQAIGKHFASKLKREGEEGVSKEDFKG